MAVADHGCGLLPITGRTNDWARRAAGVAGPHGPAGTRCRRWLVDGLGLMVGRERDDDGRLVPKELMLAYGATGAAAVQATS